MRPQWQKLALQALIWVLVFVIIVGISVENWEKLWAILLTGVGLIVVFFGGVVDRISQMTGYDGALIFGMVLAWGISREISSIAHDTRTIRQTVESIAHDTRTIRQTVELPGFSDASFQRAVMYISSPYPMKALYTQVVKNTHQAL